MKDEMTVATAKAGVAWVGVGVAWWVDVAQIVASVLAALYTTLLMCEYLWKKAIRPFCESKGWVQRRQKRRKTDA